MDILKRCAPVSSGHGKSDHVSLLPISLTASLFRAEVHAKKPTAIAKAETAHCLAVSH